MKKVLRFSAIGSKTMAPIRTLKNTIDEGDISSTATFRNRYGIPHRKPSNANLLQPDLVNYFPLPKIAFISKAISE